MEDDSVLVEGCKRNNPASFEKLYEKYASKMKGVAFRYVGNSIVAEDIIQEAFIKIFVNIQSFDDSGSFPGLLNRVVVNASIDQFNKLKKHNETFSELEFLSGNRYEVQQEEYDQYDYTIDEMMEAVNRLPSGYKLVFNMYVIDDFSHKDIAAKLNITEGTSKSQLSKAREYLKKILEKQKNDALCKIKMIS